MLFRLGKRLHSVFLSFERITTNLKRKACVKNWVWKMLACFFFLELFFKEQNQGNSSSCFKFWPFFGPIWFKMIYLLHTNCFDSFAPIIVQILLQPKPVYQLLPCSVPTLYMLTQLTSFQTDSQRMIHEVIDVPVLMSQCNYYCLTKNK